MDIDITCMGVWPRMGVLPHLSLPTFKKLLDSLIQICTVLADILIPILTHKYKTLGVMGIS